MKKILENQVAEFEAELKVVSAKLAQFPKNEVGLTLESAKTDEWKALKAKSSALFSAIRKLNSQIVRMK
jgi:hypothetical protein